MISATVAKNVDGVCGISITAEKRMMPNGITVIRPLFTPNVVSRMWEIRSMFRDSENIEKTEVDNRKNASIRWKKRPKYTSFRRRYTGELSWADIGYGIFAV